MSSPHILPKAPSYRLPVVFSVGLHTILIIFLFIELTSPAYYRAPSSGVPKVVMATMITEASPQPVQKPQSPQFNKAPPAPTTPPPAKTEAVPTPQPKAPAIDVEKLSEKNLAAEKRRQQLAKAKALEEKLQKALMAKEKRELKKQALREKQKQLQQKMLMQEIAKEKSGMTEKDQDQSQQTQGQIDEYKARIIEAIEQQWVIPADADKKLSSLFMVRLSPDGNVLAVTLLRSSGNEALDRSAEEAIRKAAPLPVPKDPTVFDKFRELRLTVSPKNVIGEVS